jgi:Winged helix DNA-binding domain
VNEEEMTSLNIAHQRLHTQHIASATSEKPGDLVQWLGAVQAQDYAAAKWALGLRSQGVTDRDVEQAFTDGTILRTHVMRPTWHFVTPSDISWMLTLTAPRVHALNAFYYRKLELDDTLFARSNAVLEKALYGGKQLTRPELISILQRAGIATGDLLRFGYLMIRAELDGIICSGARRGKQHTYALLDERAPQARTLERDEALAELAKRYFTSHGPATLKDYIWWSGLSAADAKAGLELIKPQLFHEVVDGQIYWFAASMQAANDMGPTAYLLPNYDEYIVGYTDRSAVFEASHTKKLDSRGNVLFNHTIVIDGQIVGTWKRMLKKDAVVIEANPFVPLSEAETRAVAIAAERYGRFLGTPAALHI